MNPRNDPQSPGTPPSPAAADEAVSPRPSIDSATLFGGANEIVIRHGGREYRLRRTRLDKLILTA